MSSGIRGWLWRKFARTKTNKYWGQQALRHASGFHLKLYYKFYRFIKRLNEVCELDHRLSECSKSSHLFSVTAGSNSKGEKETAAALDKLWAVKQKQVNKRKKKSNGS